MFVVAYTQGAGFELADQVWPSQRTILIITRVSLIFDGNCLLCFESVYHQVLQCSFIFCTSDNTVLSIANALFIIVAYVK